MRGNGRLGEGECKENSSSVYPPRASWCLFVQVEVNRWLQLKNGHIPETTQCYSENFSTLVKHEKNKTKYYDTSPFAFPPHSLVSVAPRQTAWKPEECLISNHSSRWCGLGGLYVGWGLGGLAQAPVKAMLKKAWSHTEGKVVQLLKSASTWWGQR